MPKQFIEFDRAKLSRFKEVYDACVLDGRQSFPFEGEVFLVDYAKYVIEYLTNKYKEIDDVEDTRREEGNGADHDRQSSA